MNVRPVITTVTYNTWETYTERLIRMVEHYTVKEQLLDWIIVDNNSADWTPLKQCEIALPNRKIREDENIGDIPRYNRQFEWYHSRELDFAIALSTDVRLITHDWVEHIMRPFDDLQVAMVGRLGPSGMGPRHADPEVSGGWHWVPKLLVDRGIEFDDCAHVQTHFFAIRLSAFNEVGGFWEPEDKNYLEKSNLIAGEVSLGAKLTKAGYKLSNQAPPHYHYGNQAASQGDLDDFDRQAGWKVDF